MTSTTDLLTYSHHRTPHRRAARAVLPALGLLVSVVAANYVTGRYGFVPVGFGLTAAAGTYAAGFALALRDAVQDAAGRVAVIAVVIVAAVVSYVVAPANIATASAAAFLLAELIDFAVYTPLRARSRVGDKRWTTAVVASNTVGAVVDTAVFVGLAFGWAAVSGAMTGQLVGKGWATVAYLAVGYTVAAVTRRR